MHDRGQSLVRLGPDNENRVAVVCVPQAAAGAAVFSSWPEAFSGTAAIWAARFPGRENRIFEPPLESIGDMAAALAGQVHDMPAEVVLLFGHCSGALIAYELAHLLVRSGTPSRQMHVVISAQPAPNSGQMPAQPVADMPLSELLEHISKLGGTADKILASDELIELMVPAIRADLRAIERYGHAATRGKLPVPITVIGGRNDTLVDVASLRRWANYTNSSFALHLIEADHFYLSENQDRVIEILQDVLKEATDRLG